VEPLRYNDLEINFTTSFAWKWDDRGSGGRNDGAYWHPQTADGYYPVGDLGQAGYGDPNGHRAIAVVRDTAGASGTALRPPTGFERIWTDRGSGAHEDGSMWRPIPPPGYVALGLVCNRGYDEPSTDIVRCVRTNLVVPARAGGLIWDDTGTGVHDDFGSWGIDAPDAPPGHVYLAPGTFIGALGHTAPTRDPNAYAFRLDLVETAPAEPTPPEPSLHGFVHPAPFEHNTVTYSTFLPWFTVSDPNLSQLQQLASSPVYRIDRVDRYKLVGFGHNKSDESQTFTFTWGTGANGSEEKSFSSTTGIELGGEWGSEAVGFKGTIRLKQEFTYTTSSSRGWETTTEEGMETHVPPGAAVAAYIIKSTYSLFRQDGTQVAQDVAYDTPNSLYWTQYPPRASVSVSPPAAVGATQG
jgi:hypothetical protein